MLKRLGAIAGSLGLLASLMMPALVLDKHARAYADDEETATEAKQEESKEPATLEERVQQLEEKVKGVDETLNEDMRPTLDQAAKVKFSGYYQFRYEIADAKTGGVVTDTRNFWVRRGYLKAATSIGSGQYNFQIDASKSGVSLKDAYVDWDIPGFGTTLRFGQTNWVYGYYVPQSSSDLIMPERPNVIATEFPGERDRGIIAIKKFGGTEKQIPVTLMLGLYNGSGVDAQTATINTYNGMAGTGITAPAGYTATVGDGAGQDDNRLKDWIVRVASTPMPNLNVGLSLYRGKNLVTFTKTGSATINQQVTKNRTGFDFQYYNEMGWGLEGEYVDAKDADLGTTGYAIQLSKRLQSPDLLAVMYDNMKRGTTTFKAKKIAWIHWFEGGPRFRLCKEFGAQASDGVDRNKLTAELQVTF